MDTSVYTVQPHWQPMDRAAHYGDGVFTTMKVVDGLIEHASYHLSRLRTDTQRIGLPAPDELLWQLVMDNANTLKNGVLKVVLSAGIGGRGYQRPSQLHPVAHVFTAAIPDSYQSWQQQGIALGLSSVQLAQQPLLAGVKHLNRLEQILIKNELAQMAYDDVVVSDSHGNIIESSSANLFVLNTQGVWQTPSLEFCGVAGVKRAYLIDALNSLASPVAIATLTVDDLVNADAMMITNAIMGVVPVHSFNGHPMNIVPVKALAQRLGQ